MRNLTAFCCLLACSMAFSPRLRAASYSTTFSHIDDLTSGWASCTGGCGGGTSAYNYWMAQNQTSPSLDGASTEFYVDGPAWANTLFYLKLGPHDSLSHFQFDFWVQVDKNSTSIGQALEFDAFQFVNGQYVMFGTQCDYGNGRWDVWNAGAGTWQPTSVSCPQFTPNAWYHITWNFHRSGNSMVYDNFTVAQYNSSGYMASRSSHNLNLTYASAPLPAGWTDNLGVQFQIDLNGQAGVNANPASTAEYVDKVTLTGW
ncbi:MAG: hypothetical protein JO041_04990 [Acidobacteria bacterium]|nr:hypothetical protein [Acidobacteriota bacterium]